MAEERQLSHHMQKKALRKTWNLDLDGTRKKE